MTLTFDMNFVPSHGVAVEVAPGIARVTCANASPFTFHGTNSYIVGTDTLAVIDPGPEDDAHLAALIAAIDGRPVSYIFVTHTHRDHSPLAERLKAATGAPTVAEGPHRDARPLRIGEAPALDAANDTAFMPDIRLADGEAIDGDGWRLSAVHTPGHAANHAVFALDGTGVAFSGDHVMAWSTSIVAPPGGAMSDYMASLDKLIERGDRRLLPGHGGPVEDPAAFMRGLRTHRKMRERAIVERLRAGDRTIAEIVRAIYRDTDPRLHAAAGLSVLAHLEDLVARAVVAADGEVAIDGVYRPS
ncbi:MAG: MBL fold metallo-hydrolase [Rhizobiaceae bacterium]|nr:MBL fold metallo-hydrolase [Rhizobiaceae bacterium]